MKNLLLNAVFLITLSAFSFSAKSQNSLKFIDGIDLKSTLVEYATVMAEPAVSKIPSDRKVAVKRALDDIPAIEQFNSLQFKYALLMDIEIESLTNISLLALIDEWWETRYRYGGTSKKGIDCSALTGLLLNTVYAIKAPRTAKRQYAASDKLGREELHEGDLVFFNTRGGISHVGMYLNNDYFVHASSSNGVTISNLNDAYYNARYVGGGRLINTE